MDRVHCPGQPAYHSVVRDRISLKAISLARDVQFLMISSISTFTGSLTAVQPDTAPCEETLEVSNLEGPYCSLF